MWMSIVSNHPEDSLIEPNPSLDDPFIITSVISPLEMLPLPWKDHYAKDIVPNNNEDSTCPCKVHKSRIMYPQIRLLLFNNWSNRLLRARELIVR